MRGLLIRWLVNALALGFTSWIIKGIEVSGVVPIFVACLVLGILNAVLRPILFFLTLPLNVLTFGIFTFVINGFLLMITSKVVDGFYVSGFWSAFVGAILLSIISTFLSFLVGD
ncbi:MAG: phage holin family protein [Candidatus Hydrothermota bacterium]|nr:MAG: phage holin family protein [Candidatus Hydrothermae bacterium]